MYSGQFENVQLPIGTLGWCTAVDAFLPELSPFTPPQAARNADPGPSRRPAPARWRMNWRRECSLPSSIRSTMPSRSSCGIGGLLSLDDERVGGVPGQRDVAAGADRAGSVAVTVGGDHGELTARLGLHDVLDRRAEVARDGDAAVDDVAARARRLAGRVGCRDRDLLRANGDADRPAVDVPEAVAGHEDAFTLFGVEGRHRAVARAQAA